jgi:hypothetical protein
MEITCPRCHFARTIPDEKIPERAEIATCPKCKHKFQFRHLNERDPLPPLVAAEPSDVRQPDSESLEQEPEADPEPQGTLSTQTDDQGKKSPASEDFWDKLASMGAPHQDTGLSGPPPDVTPDGEIEVPWERLDIYGFFPGLWETIKRAMLQPVAFFRSMPVGTGQTKPLIFYLLVAEFQIVLQMLWELTGVVPDMAGQEGATGISVLMLLVGYPIILTLLLYIMAGLVHVCLHFVGVATRGFEGTFRALTYGSAPMVLTLIPMIGPVVGAVWSLVITFFGYKHIHRTTNAKVILAMLLPLIPFILFLAVVMTMAQRSGVPTF